MDEGTRIKVISNVLDTKIMASLLGRKGGQATSKKYGKKHYSQIGKKGMLKRWGGKK